MVCSVVKDLRVRVGTEGGGVRAKDSGYKSWGKRFRVWG